METKNKISKLILTVLLILSITIPTIAETPTILTQTLTPTDAISAGGSYPWQFINLVVFTNPLYVYSYYWYGPPIGGLAGSANAYLKFDLTTIPKNATIRDAKLTLINTETSSIVENVTVSLFDNNNWNGFDNSILFQQGYLTLIDYQNVMDAGQYTWNVTRAINTSQLKLSSNIISFELATDSHTNQSCNEPCGKVSFEGNCEFCTNSTRLVVNYIPNRNIIPGSRPIVIEPTSGPNVDNITKMKLPPAGQDAASSIGLGVQYAEFDTGDSFAQYVLDSNGHLVPDTETSGMLRTGNDFKPIHWTPNSEDIGKIFTIHAEGQLSEGQNIFVDTEVSPAEPVPVNIGVLGGFIIVSGIVARKLKKELLKLRKNL